MRTYRWMVMAPALLLAVLFTLGLTSCATKTALQSSWELPNYEGRPLTDLAVISIMKDKKQSVAFESTVVQDLDANGVSAVPGFSFMKGDTTMSEEEMEQRVDATGADGVLIFKVLALNTDASYVPPTAYYVPDGYGYGWWDDPYWGYYTPYPYSYWGYWYPAMQVVGSPGYWDVSTDYVVQTALYRTRDNRLIWTAVSDTWDPSSEADLAKSLSDVVVKRMLKTGLVR